jgi:hypothetical protein
VALRNPRRQAEIFAKTSARALAKQLLSTIIVLRHYRVSIALAQRRDITVGRSAA